MSDVDERSTKLARSGSLPPPLRNSPPPPASVRARSSGARGFKSVTWGSSISGSSPIDIERENSGPPKSLKLEGFPDATPRQKAIDHYENFLKDHSLSHTNVIWPKAIYGSDPYINDIRLDFRSHDAAKSFKEALKETALCSFNEKPPRRGK